ncbi:ComF family protein [Rubrivivax rivuli]|uniref:ComF family protein n=1 Tax=Rubrivivax rivuli TaxID=1862385 RepID=A0A437RLM2_9BURK|nr:ComF family protein [Rubrivivax rivuli]RVU47703.1 ComF family protein [Rubrivivax rivuli]
MRRHAPARLTLPQQCEVCRRWADSGICAECLCRFAAPRPRCTTCGLVTGLALPRCGACLREPPPFECTVCVADYAYPWDRLITAFKFHGRAELAMPLAELLAAAVRRSVAQAPRPWPDTVLPVPLAPARLRERGYNQAWELARHVARTLALPSDAALLQRPLDTAHQSALTRSERQRNLRTAFMADPQRRNALQGRRVALVDDVMTTGATVRESAAVLRRAGAAAVEVWVLARTPDNPTAD